MCELCEGRGWILSLNVNLLRYGIERCDACKTFDSDEKAGEIAEEILDTMEELL